MRLGDASSPKHESDGLRVSSPMVSHDVGSGAFHDVSKDESRDDRVVESADPREELGDQVDGGGEPEGAEHQQDLRGTGHPFVTEQTAEETDQVRKEGHELSSDRFPPDHQEDDGGEQP